MNRIILTLCLLFILGAYQLSQNQAKPKEPLVVNNNSHKNNKKITVPTIDDLKQSDWYRKALKQIQESEYYFSKDPDEEVYSTPNRNNNLRFNYTKNGFSVEPRTTRIPQGNYDENTPAGDIKYKKLANWNIAFNVDTTQIGEGTWEINNNIAEYITKDVTVQYINNEQGMRQNFIVQHSLANQDTTCNTLRLNFSVKTGLHCKLNGNALRFYHNTSNVLSYQDLKVWDANHKPLVANFVEQSNADSISTTRQYAIVVNTENAVYPITIDPISTTPNTTLSYTATSNALFGWSVASAGDVNGDGYSDVIVGVLGYGNGQPYEGAAFIYHGSSTGIGSTPNTILEINAHIAEFGWSVSTPGDLNGDGYSDVIVSTKDLNFGQRDEGGVYVYYGSANGINTANVYFLEANQAYAYFGWSVACAGDVNGDGYSDVLVGAPYFDIDGTTDGGVVFVYHGSASGLILTPADTLYQKDKFYITFGKSVASAGDLNADGFSDIVIGAPLFTDNSDATPDEGAAFVYYGSATGIVNSPTILQCDQARAEMGNAVASAGDVNGDGYADLIIGAEHYSSGQINEGVAFIYHGSATGVSNSASFVLEVNQTAAQLGTSVASAGDINGDGYGDVIVGQPGFGSNNNNTRNAGKAYVFQGSATGLSNTNTSLYIGTGGAKFGNSVASAGDINGDGYSDIIVGEPNTGGNAYIYHGAPQGVDIFADARRESKQGDAQMGKSVASAGDVNGDGYSDVIIGAPSYDNGQYKEGAAFIYLGSANGLATTGTFITGNLSNALFGASVSTAGDVNGDGYSDVIVGACGYTNGETNEGAFFIYHGSATGINTIPAFVRESGQINAQFGNTVSAAGDLNGDGYSDVIVGSELYDNGQTDEGAAFVYYGSTAGITLAGSILLEANQGNARFGEAVSTAGDVNGDGYSDLIVGAYNYTNGETNEGAFYIYHGSAAGINTSYAFMRESGQVNAQFGTAVSSAGDINGDGYSDVIVGSEFYDNGQTDEGAAFVYYGSASGITLTGNILLEANEEYAHFGQTVSTAGDVNGDGYSDVVVGAYLYGSIDAGAAFVYHGSSTGINTNAATFLNTNQTNAALGSDVASAGDVNGDGYSDIIVGARYIDYGEGDEGAAFIYHGNEATSVSKAPKAYNIDLQTGINRTNFNYNIFGIGLKSKSFLGRTKGRLVWEIKPNGQAFNGSPITNSIYSNGNQSGFTDLVLTGTELKSIVLKQGNYSKIRVRVQYEKVNAITGQMYGPWRYLNVNMENKVKGCTAPTITISGTTNLTCVVTSVTRTASGGVSYAWSGPNSFTANTAQATITTAGTYTVTVTAANGCNAIATTQVNFTAPPANISGTANLTCVVSSITRTATGGVSYVWSGPNSYSANTAQATITAPGTYTVTVTGSDGCTATATTQVLLDNAAPSPTISGTDILTCYYQSVKRTASGGVSYAWSGPNSFSANTAQATITAAGIYTVTVTGANGCTATATTEVISDTIPVTVTISGTDSLNCNTSSVTRTASGGNFYAWTGPNSSDVIALTAQITITAPGLYTVYTRGDNFCLATATTQVILDNSPPTVIISGSENLNCSFTSVTRTASGGVSYSWSGPNSFTANTAAVNVNVIGTYTVTGANGCTATTTTVVAQDLTPPTPNITGNTNLNCSITSVNRTASGGAAYSWTGPNSFTANTAVVNISAAGTYTVIVTGANGCTATTTTAVTQDLTPPTPNIIGTANLTCSVTSVSRTASGGISYNWSGPNSFTANTAVVNISVAGTYTVTVKGANGCSAQTTTVVNVSSVNFVTQPSSVEICQGNNADFQVNVSTSGVSYQWQSNQSGAFADLTNSGLYSGVNSNSLHLQFPAASLNGIVYRCKVKMEDCEFFSAIATLTVRVAADDINVTLVNNITGEENFQAKNYGYALNKNFSGSRVDFKAGKAIELQPGFEAKVGSVFSAKIQSACDN